MRTVTAKRIAIFLVVPLLLQAAELASARDRDLEARVARIEQMSQNTLDILRRLESLQRELRELRGDVEMQAYEIRNLKNRQRDLYLDLDQRMGRIDGRRSQPLLDEEPKPTRGPAAGSGAAPPPSSPAGVAPTERIPYESLSPSQATRPSTVYEPRLPSTEPELPPTPYDPRASAPTAVATLPPPGTGPMAQNESAAYQAAFELLRRGNYKDAKAAFQTFLGDYPNSAQADEARYWLGEANYVTRDFQPALEQFEHLLAEYPNSGRVPEAMLKIGYIYDETGASQRARDMLKDLASQYPSSGAARLADQRLERMRAQKR
jgi:tol-pal system protein YbgF